MIDFHSHILPRMDDGSKSRDMSMAMLISSRKQGIETMVATPHFYINKESAIDKFIDSRQASFSALSERIQEENADVPDIIMGAEVYFFRGMYEYEHLEKLVIGNTKYFMLEMPFEKWNERTFTEIEDIIHNRNLTPVIAHIDRYFPFQKGTDNISRLVSMDMPIQMNADFVNTLFTRKQALELISDGIVTLLGSDCHNMDKRKPNLGKCLEIIGKKLGSDTVNNIHNHSKSILGL